MLPTTNGNCPYRSTTLSDVHYVHPPSPADDPRGALLRLSRNMFWSNWIGTSGSKIEDLQKKRLNGRLRSPALHLLERSFVPWCQCCPCQTLTCSGNFTTPDASLSNSLSMDANVLGCLPVEFRPLALNEEMKSLTLLCQHDPCSLVGGATRMALNRNNFHPCVFVFRLQSNFHGGVFQKPL